MIRLLRSVAAALVFALALSDAHARLVVMHGFVDQASITLWTQTVQRAGVAIEFHPDNDAAAVRRVEGTTRAEDDHALHLRLANLKPGTTYRYRALVDGVIAAEGSFRTQPLWQFRSDPPDFAVAFGSCAYLNDEFSRPGTPWGGDYRIFEVIATKRPDLMLWLGDNVYFRAPEWTSSEGMSARYRAYRALPQLQTLLRAASHLAVWDDHDFGPNDADGSFALKGAALDVFKRYWANPSYGLPGVSGVFGMATFGDVDFFLLDNRFHRYPNRYPHTPDKTMFGPAQREWLKQALLASRATFKIVVAGGQFWNRRNRFESLHNYPEDQQALGDWLVAQRIEGVVFLSGDRHFAELLRVPRPGTYPLYEFTSSPLTAGAFSDPPAEERDNPALVAGTLVTQRNFGMLRVSGPLKARELVFESYDASGALLWQRRINAAELK